MIIICMGRNERVVVLVVVVMVMVMVVVVATPSGRWTNERVVVDNIYYLLHCTREN